MLPTFERRKVYWQVNLSRETKLELDEKRTGARSPFDNNSRRKTVLRVIRTSVLDRTTHGNLSGSHLYDSFVSR